MVAPLIPLPVARVDSTESATAQGALWSADPEGWARNAERRLQPLYETILARVSPKPEARLLDAGCGSGGFVRLASRRGAVAIGLDAAPGLVTYARKRVPSATFVVGDLMALPFSDGAFDVVTALNSVLYAADPAAALAELARVVSPSGRVVVCVGSDGESAACAARIDPLLPPGLEASSRTTFDLHNQQRTAQTMLACGLRVCDQDDVVFGWDFADVEEAVRAQMSAGPVVAAERHSGRRAVEAALRAFFEPRSRPDGSVRMDIGYRYVVAERVGSDRIRRRIADR